MRLGLVAMSGVRGLVFPVQFNDLFKVFDGQIVFVEIFEFKGHTHVDVFFFFQVGQF